LHRILILIGTDYAIVRGDSEYGTPIAIWDMSLNDNFDEADADADSDADSGTNAESDSDADSDVVVLVV
jgi:hypothetical protein